MGGKGPGTGNSIHEDFKGEPTLPGGQEVRWRVG